MSSNNTTFLCRACEKERGADFKVVGRRICTICDAYRRHIRRVKKPLPFPKYEARHIKNKELRERSAVICRGCKTEKKRAEVNQRSLRCPPCHSQYKTWYSRTQRYKEAKRENRVYEPRHLHDAHVHPYIEHIKMESHVFAYEERNSRISECIERMSRPPRGRLRTVAEKLAHLTDKQVERIYRKTSRPWLNPRLSAGERYKLKYQMCKDFVIQERVRNRMRKKHGRWISNYIRSAIVRNGSSPTVLNLLGYSIAELRQHLENQFTDGMNWDEFMEGNIHIDHIIPMAAFNMRCEDDFKRCWALSNLQPLWASDNIAKGARMPLNRLVERRKKP